MIDLEQFLSYAHRIDKVPHSRLFLGPPIGHWGTSIPLSLGVFLRPQFITGVAVLLKKSMKTVSEVRTWR